MNRCLKGLALRKLVLLGNGGWSTAEAACSAAESGHKTIGRGFRPGGRRGAPPLSEACPCESNKRREDDP